MIPCPPRDWLEQLLGETLPPERQDELERHLLDCDACQERLGQLTSNDTTSRWRKCQAEAGGAPATSELFLRRLVAAGDGDPGTIRVGRGSNGTARGGASAQVGHATEPTAAGAAGPAGLPAVPGYDVLEELGRGGMGVVYKARHRKLNRTVALKMILAGAQAGADVRAFFHAEAEVIARLQHPNIVQIYEIGEVPAPEGQPGGLPFLALEYLDGGSLAQRLAGAPQPARAAAALTETLARAVHFAHERGVVHRDLKPANILLEKAEGGRRKAEENPEGEAGAEKYLSSAFRLPPSAFPKITDFGLAKRLDGGQTLLASGVLAGTPSYMAPEQVSGARSATGPAADVYALGAVLYEALTGRPPFKGESTYETLLQVAHEEPVPPRQLQPRLPLDLETVCLKCLEKDPRKRYPTAAALAEDCAAFLRGEPITARPVGRLGRAARWARRSPALASALAAVVLVALTGLALVLWQWGRAEATAVSERVTRVDAQAKEAAEKEARREVERRSAATQIDQGSALCEKGDVAHGLLAFARGLDLAAGAGDADLERVARHNLAAWPERLIRLRAVFRHRGQVIAVAFAPDGRLAATAGADSTVRRWDPATGRPVGEPLQAGSLVLSLAFSPNGKILLAGTAGRRGVPPAALLWDAATGKALHSPLAHPAYVSAVAFDRGGGRFLTVCPGQARLWDTASGKAGPRLHAGAALCAAFSPDGSTVLTGGADATARLWDAATGEERLAALRQCGPVFAVAFAPDGRSAATAGQAQKRAGAGRPEGVLWTEVRLWRTSDGEAGPVLTLHGLVHALAFSPDSRTLATGSGLLEWREHRKDLHAFWGEARLWDAATGRLRGQPLLHPEVVCAVAFSPDGHRLLTGCRDGRARLFGVEGGDLIGAPLEHEGTVAMVAFSPKDGRLGLTASSGGDDVTGAAARLWELPAAPPSRRPALGFGEVVTLALTRDGKGLVAGSRYGGKVACWDLGKSRRAGALLAHDDLVRMVVFSPDERLLLTASRDGKARIWDRGSGRLVRTFDQGAPVVLLALSPDGQRLLTARMYGVTVWDAHTGARLLDADYPKQGRVAAVAFNAAGDALWIESNAQAARLWRCAPGGKAEQLWQGGDVFCASFQQGGQAVLLAGVGRYPQLRDVQTGRPLGSALPRQRDRITGLAVSADGRTVAVGGWDRTARLWDVATGKPLGPPLGHDTLVSDLALQGEGRLLVTGDEGGVRLWRLPAPLAGSPARVRLWAEILTGMELTPEGAVRELGPEALAPRRQRLAEAGGPPQGE